MENTEILINNEYRMDGRKPKEIRVPELQLDLVQNASGSCMINIGETKVLAWILGPKESRSKNLDKGSVKCEFNISPFANTNRKSDFKRNLQMREFTSTLKEIFEEVILLKQYIKCEIEIQVNVLQNDGSYKAAAITAVTLALISAGILIQDTAVGVSVGIMEGDFYFSDLIREEERLKKPILNACYLPSKSKFVFLEITNAALDYNKSETLMKFAEEAGETTFNHIKEFLKNVYLI